MHYSQNAFLFLGHVNPPAGLIQRPLRSYYYSSYALLVRRSGLSLSVGRHAMGRMLAGELSGESFFLRRRRWRSGQSELTLRIGSTDATGQSAVDTQREVVGCHRRRSLPRFPVFRYAATFTRSMRCLPVAAVGVFLWESFEGLEPISLSLIPRR